MKGESAILECFHLRAAVLDQIKFLYACNFTSNPKTRVLCGESDYYDQSSISTVIPSKFKRPRSPRDRCYRFYWAGQLPSVLFVPKTSSPFLVVLGRSCQMLWRNEPSAFYCEAHVPLGGSGFLQYSCKDSYLDESRVL